MRVRALSRVRPTVAVAGAVLGLAACSSGAPSVQPPVTTPPPLTPTVTQAAAPGPSEGPTASPAPPTVRSSAPGGASPSTPAPTATVTVTVSAAPAPPATPSGAATTIGTHPGILTGVWGGHGRELVVRRDGSSTVTYRTYRTCGDDSPPCDTVKGNTIYDGGRITMRITRVVTAHHTTTATVTVLTSTEPDFPAGSTQSLLLDGDVINLGRGFTFCDDKAPAGTCGA